MKKDQIIVSIRKKGMGSKPDYYLELKEDGSVFYEGFEKVKTLGKVEKKITKVKFAELLSIIRDFKFFKLDDDYSIVDDPSYPRTIISATIPVKDGSIQSKTITYFQKDPTIPDELKIIENKIHEIVEFEKWHKTPIKKKDVLASEQKIEPKVEVKKVDKIIGPKPVEKKVKKPKSIYIEKKPIKPLIKVIGIIAVIVILFLVIGALTVDNNFDNSHANPSISIISSAGEINGIGDFTSKQDFEQGEDVLIYLEFQNFSKIDNKYDISIQKNLFTGGEVFRQKNSSYSGSDKYLDISFTSDETWPEGKYYFNVTLKDNPTGKSFTSSISFNISKESLKIDVLATASQVGGLNNYTPAQVFSRNDTFYVYVEYSNFIFEENICNLTMELYVTEVNGDKEYLPTAYTETNANNIEHHWSIKTDVSWGIGEYLFRVKITDNLSLEETQISDYFELIG